MSTRLYAELTDELSELRSQLDELIALDDQGRTSDIDIPTLDTLLQQMTTVRQVVWQLQHELRPQWNEFADDTDVEDTDSDPDCDYQPSITVI